MLSQSTGVLVFGGLLIIVAIIVIGFFAIGLSRRTNQRRRTDTTVGEGNIPRDPDVGGRTDNAADVAGNFDRTVPGKQDTNKNART